MTPTAQTLKACGLSYVEATDLSVRRKKWGRGFRYIHRQDGPITCSKQRAYFASLAIPPAYTDVMLSPVKHHYLRAVGRDTSGNRQYFYHPKWENFRDERKFQRLFPIAQRLPAIRRIIRKHLKAPNTNQTYVLASLVRLLDYTGLRIGNWTSANEKDTYGLITLHKNHFKTDYLQFTGKANQDIERSLFHHPVKEILEHFYDSTDTLDAPLFTYEKEGKERVIRPWMINDYLDDISRINMTAKEFRTWRSCALFVKYWRQHYDREELHLKTILEAVAEHTCNTPAILKSSYIHPMLLKQFKSQPAVIKCSIPKRRGLRSAERLLMTLIEENKSAP